MSALVTLLNGVVVSLFGAVLSASFCGALNTGKKRRGFVGCMAGIFLLQGVLYLLWGSTFLRWIYPVVFHIPLMLALCCLTRTFPWPVFSVFLAYLCCQPRRWIALLATKLISGGPMTQEVAELIVSLPLLLVLLRFVSPSIRHLARGSAKTQFRFAAIPMIYYVFDYLTAVYTDLLVSGGFVVVEFMPFVCSASYLVFLLYHSVKEQERFRLRQTEEALRIQVNQSVREIGALRESQMLARRYRHDIRHHLQYLSACIENNQPEQAQSYISGICRQIEAQKVECYCENEAANLILSSFAGRAGKEGSEMKIQGALPAFIIVSDSDLCVLLSNALENALNACRPLAAEGVACTIEVRFFERESKLFLQVINPCGGQVRFENGLPVSDRPGHGIGVQSICAIVQRYGGVYSFTVEEGKFILRISV